VERLRQEALDLARGRRSGDPMNTRAEVEQAVRDYRSGTFTDDAHME
jgi:hypothetical protein